MYKLSQDIVPLNMLNKFCIDRMKTALHRKSDKANSGNFGYFKGLNPKVPCMMWLVIKLGLDIMPKNMFNRFGEDRVKNVLTLVCELAQPPQVFP